MADIYSKSKRSEVMRKVKGKNTKPELLLRKELWKEGFRGWRIHPKTLPGKPDIAFTKYKVAVFVDGCFWHGCERCYKRPSINQAFWDKKLTANINRDKRNENSLIERGWKIVRFWEHDIKKEIAQCTKTIADALDSSPTR